MSRRSAGAQLDADPHIDALENAAAPVEETTVEGLLERSVGDAGRGFDATWVVRRRC